MTRAHVLVLALGMTANVAIFVQAMWQRARFHLRRAEWKRLLLSSYPGRGNPELSAVLGVVVREAARLDIASDRIPELLEAYAQLLREGEPEIKPRGRR